MPFTKLSVGFAANYMDVDQATQQVEESKAGTESKQKIHHAGLNPAPIS
jgi:hypothetical protein